MTKTKYHNERLNCDQLSICQLAPVLSKHKWLKRLLFVSWSPWVEKTNIAADWLMDLLDELLIDFYSQSFKPGWSIWGWIPRDPSQGVLDTRIKSDKIDLYY